MAEYGIRVDIIPEVNPDCIGDAHSLMFRDETFDLVFLDPPYTDDYSASLYGTGRLNFKRYSQEAVRVLKEGGWLVVYHFVATPQIPGTVMVKRIFIETRPWHRPRVVHIHRKSEQEWRMKSQEIEQVKQRRRENRQGTKSRQLQMF